MYLMATVVNDTTGETKRVCIEGTTLFDAVRFENGLGRGPGLTINQEDGDLIIGKILANTARTYHFKTVTGWQIVQPVYTPDYLVLVHEETRSQSTEELARRFDGLHSPGGFFTGDLQPGNRAAYSAAFAYVLTERGLTVRRDDFSGSLHVVTPKMLADAAKEQRVSNAAEQKRKAANRAFAARLPGYFLLNKSFTVASADMSLITLARDDLYAFSATLQPKKPALITDFFWLNPVNQKTNKAQNDWSQFLPLTKHIERLAQRYSWLRAWKNAGPNRRIEAQLFGTLPHNEWGEDIKKEVVPAWNDAGLGGAPYCELILRWKENAEDCWAVLYLSPPHSHETRALVTRTHVPSYATGAGAFWLDRLRISSWATSDPRECVVVSPDGQWKRLKLPLRTPLRP